jgi:DNA-binding LacI/PurR family transcriptional regulator
MAKVTIEDISRQTGLSRGTVSRALNDRADISQQTKQRVLNACRELKYVPSHAARSLATGRRYAVAVVVDDLRCTGTAGLLRGVLQCAREARYVVHVTELGPDGDEAIEQLANMVNERVDGVLLATPLSPTALRRFVEIAPERPIVACAAQESVVCDAYLPDYVEAGRLAAHHLLRCARNDVGSILYVLSAEDPGASASRAGFDEVLRGPGRDPHAVTVTAPARSGASDRLAPIRDRVVAARAIGTTSDALALEIMLLCHRGGRTPGRDVAILGQGNEPIGERLIPALTTIDYGYQELGRRAMETALQRIGRSRLDAPQQVLVAPRLIERDSTRLPG